MEIKLNIPDYLSVKQWKLFVSMEYLGTADKMIKMISILSDKKEDEISTWSPLALQEVYGKVLDAMTDIEPQFYPIFELDGVLYGFNSISKMTLGEYVDLERLAKKPQDNIEEIMAILYRPIEKNRLNGIKWAFRNKHKVALGEAENLFKYYEVEKYDSKLRIANSEKLSVIPASLALGALTFFLVLANTSLIGSNLSSISPIDQMTAMKEMNSQMASMNIGDGLLQFITSQQHPSFRSQEILQYLN